VDGAGGKLNFKSIELDRRVGPDGVPLQWHIMLSLQT
jgi:hypothetical protein